MPTSVRQTPSVYSAHLGQAEPHALYNHLTSVAQRADEKAIPFSGSLWARLLGLWHDLGKYNPEWQRFLIEAIANPEDAHLEGRKRGPNHSSAGALYGLEWLRQHFSERDAKILACVLAYPIMGHHAGLADYDGGEGSLFNRLFTPDKDHLALARQGNPPLDVLLPNVPNPRDLLSALKDRDISFFIRLIFSCLVDADFLDTEAYMNPERLRGGHPTIEMLRQVLEEHMGGMVKAISPVNAIRAEVLAACLKSSAEPSGFFSLIVPTGGGKTLSSLAFALAHAQKHGKRRVIYAIPYTSIIEQTAEVFRKVFHAHQDAVIEHHSNVADTDANNETSRQRLASENWDAPLIVTTTVQLFESLYASRTSRCRKLHNIADSIIILDEAHLMPPELRTPILHTLHQLVQFYGVTVVLCTATPTGLEDMKRERKYVTGLRPIIADADALYTRLERVKVEIRPEAEKVTDWKTLAAELASYEQVLCIVGRRNDCRDLYAAMPNKGSIHLSALMCAEHRSRVIADIKNQLAKGAPVRVISTQLVEAGVDVDFPVVYRVMAGLDSIAQAAGRCNREGKLNGLGKVVVFRTERGAPRGILKWAEQAAEAVLRNNPEAKVLSPQMQQRYFHDFYNRCENGDKYGIMDLLKANKGMCYQFRAAAEKFRIVEDNYRSVIVRYDNDGLLAQIASGRPERRLLRKAQRYTVSIPQDYLNKLMTLKAVKEVLPGLFMQDIAYARDMYDPTIGLAKDYSADYSAADLVV